MKNRNVFIKIRGFSAILLIMVPVVLLAQNNTYDSISVIELTDDEELNIVRDIRAKFKTINENISTYSKVEVDLMGHSTEGGYYLKYLDKNEIKKVSVTYYGETAKLEIEYYLWEGKVFFIFHQHFRYNSPIYLNIDLPEEGIEAYDENKTVVEENRYYFKDNKLIRWINNDKNKVSRTSDEFRDTQIELIDDIKFILDEVAQ